MQYILTEEEYKNLTKLYRQNRLTDAEISAYLRRLPNFGPCTIRTMLECFKEDGYSVVKNEPL